MTTTSTPATLTTPQAPSDMEEGGPAKDLRPIPAQDEVLIPAASVPDYIGIKVQTLARWRHESVGPTWVALGRRVYYRSSDLRAWIDSRARTNTIAA